MGLTPCSQQDCKVHESGECLEQLDPDVCPHHEWTDAKHDGGHTKTVSEEGEASDQATPAAPVRELHHGDPMTLHEASVITVSGPSRLIVLAGERDSGKTTLLASLYENFLKGPFCGFLFAGSLTLPGFEQRCFDARVDSGRDAAHTPHTSLRLGLRVLHLDLVHQEAGHRWNLLFGDLAGEWYRYSRESTADAQRLRVLHRADRVCLLLDGEKLANVVKRHGEVDDAEGTLRSLLEAEVLGSYSRIDVACSKWDLVHGDQAASRFVDLAFERIRGAFEKDFAELRFSRIAARPAEVTSAVPFGFGLAGLLERWALPDLPMERIETPLPAAQPSEREFTRFARRFPPRSAP